MQCRTSSRSLKLNSEGFSCELHNGILKNLLWKLTREIKQNDADPVYELKANVMAIA
jgi:hypothetical protein